jgi:prevent-host-death family protein
MKETTLETLAKNLEGVMEEAQKERILVTREGKPLALVVGLENYDEEDWGYMTSRAFWEMIRERRKSPTARLEDVKDELLRDD